MGYWKEIAIKMQESSDDEHLADKLGITFAELVQTEYKIEIDESEDGLIYGYRIVFDKNSPQQILAHIKGLDENFTVYMSPWDFNEDYDYEEQYDAIIETKNYLKKFNDDLTDLQSLSLIKIDDKLKPILLRQIFISVIGAMETFLADACINLTNENEEYFKNFVETHPEFQKQKFELRDILKEYNKLEDTVKKIMLDTIYHNLPIVSNMFKNTFKIKFPEIKKVYGYVLKRHDLVHRNGKGKDGTIVNVDENMIEELIKVVRDFVNDIAMKLNVN